MKVIPPSCELMDCPDGAAILQKIELAGRVCYKSEAKITPDSAEGFVRRRPGARKADGAHHL